MGIKIITARLVCDECSYSDEFIDQHISLMITTAQQIGWVKVQMSNVKMEEFGANRWLCKKCSQKHSTNLLTNKQKELISELYTKSECISKSDWFKEGATKLGENISRGIRLTKYSLGLQNSLKPVMGELFY